MNAFLKGQRNYLQSLLVVTLIVCMGLISIYFSPFGISDRLDNYSQDLFNKIFGKYELIYPSTGQQQISVLLLTDQTVDGQFAGKWPISYSAHARILNNLLRYSPKAVVIDYLWLNQEKPGVDHLLRVLKRFQAKEIPVYLSFRKADELNSFWPELKGLVRPISPNIAVDPSDFVARNYALKRGGLSSPAMRVYKDLYDPAFMGDNDTNMQIFWGMKTNMKNSVWMDSGDEEDSGLATLFEGFSAVKYSPPYTTTVLVRDLLNPTDTNDQAAYIDLEHHLKNKIVFYGGSIDGVSDLVYTPTRQIRPGVYYHAMALDNLISLNGSYKSTELKKAVRGRWLIPINDFLVHFLTLLVPSVIIYVRHKRKGKSLLAQKKSYCQLCNEKSVKPKAEHVVIEVGKKFIGVLGQGILTRTPLAAWILVCCWFSFSQLELAPSHWLSYLAFTEVGFYLDNILRFENATGFNREGCNV